MKKFFTLLVAIIAMSVLSANAMNITYTVSANDPEGGYIRAVGDPGAGTYYFDKGPVTISCTATYGYLYVNPNNGYMITSVICNIDGEITPLVTTPKRNYNLMLNDGYHGAEFYVEFTSIEAMKSGEICINYHGDPTTVRCQFGGTYRNVPLSEGETFEAFIPDFETPLYLLCTKPVYKVECNGEKVAPGDNYGETQYVIYIQDGDYIEVYVDYPDESYPCSVSYPTDLPGLIKSVTVAKTAVDYTNAFDVKCGQTLDIILDTDTYCIDKFAINGEDREFYSEWAGIIVEPTDITIEAHKYATYEVCLDIDDPQGVEVYHGSNGWGAVSVDNLKPGKNTIEVTEVAPDYFTIVPVVGYKIVSITDDYKAPSFNRYQGSYTCEFVAGTTIEVTTYKEPEINFVLYCNVNLDKKDVTYDFSQNFTKYYTIEQGYQPVTVLGSTPFNLTVYSDCSLFINDVEVAPTSFDKTFKEYYWDELTFNDNDLVKLFVGTYKPVMCSATLTVEGDASALSIIKDTIVKVEGDTFEALDGSQIEITSTDPNVEIVEMYVNGNEVEDSIAAGYYLFEIDGDTEIVITLSGSASIEGDVNGDGEVNIADAQRVLNIMSGAYEPEAGESNGDVNADGEVNIADVQRVLNIMSGL